MQIEIPTISSFIKFLTKISGVSIKQNEEVITAKKPITKMARFDKNFEEVANIISGGLHIEQKSYNKETENSYKKSLYRFIEYSEMIIAKGQNQFFYDETSNENFTNHILSAFFIPWFLMFHTEIIELPSSVPALYLVGISTDILLNKECEPEATIRRHLIDRVKYILNKNNKSSKQLTIFNQIGNIKKKSLTSNIAIMEMANEFLTYVGKTNENILEVNKFIDTYSCCMMLLRLKRESAKIFYLFIVSLIRTIFLVKNDDKLAGWIPKNDLEKISIFLNKPQNRILINPEMEQQVKNIIVVNHNLFSYYIVYHNIQSYLSNSAPYLESNVLDAFDDNVKYGLDYSEGIIQLMLDYAKETDVNIALIYNQFPFFNIYNRVPANILSLIKLGTRHDKINDINFLMDVKSKIEKSNSIGYYTIVTHFADLLLALNYGDTHKVLDVSEKLLYEDSLTWPLGNIKSDILLVYIGFKDYNAKIDKKFNFKDQEYLINQYYECRDNELEAILIDPEERSSNDMMNGHNDVLKCDFISLLNKFDNEKISNIANKYLLYSLGEL